MELKVLSPAIAQFGTVDLDAILCADTNIKAPIENAEVVKVIFFLFLSML